MDKNELLEKWQKNMETVELCRKKVLGVDFTYETEKHLIFSFIEDIKNLNGDTVKLWEKCEHPIEVSKCKLHKYMRFGCQDCMLNKLFE